MLKPLSRISIIVAGILLIVVLFVPLWSIELVAPQYPEGLVLIINPDGIAGNVEIINGLNHYIGMKTLHNEDFVEFKILPWLIGIFALAFILTGIIGKLRGLKILTLAFVLFGIIAMVDFWKWEYQYGHDLDPNAAIQVPGMAYQPPLIGYKQLLNFAAYSMPATGGWIFVAAGLILVFSLFFETRKMKIKTPTLAFIFLTLLLSACNKGPGKINYGTDGCDNCKMTLSDNRFGVLLHTDKGRNYKFDDVSCLLNFMDGNTLIRGNVFLTDYCSPNEMYPAEKMQLLESEGFYSPMGGNIAAFSNNDSLLYYQNKIGAVKAAIDIDR